jgi:gamma-glutamyltranspeptidase/glutathione hydrolase
MERSATVMPTKYATARDGMVATAFPLATEAGVEILAAGGNAVDAAIAAAFALGVCEPQASGLGGQTMLLVGSGGKSMAFDGSSRAPSLAHIASIPAEERALGYKATTVPSTPATLGYVHRRYGVLPLERVLEPAIRIATDGYPITDLQHRLQLREMDAFQSVPSRSGARYYLNNGNAYEIGARFKQPELAATLRRIAEHGVEDFYRGEIARQIDADMRAHDGLLRSDDLSLIPWPIERRALKSRFRGLSMHTMPPPGAGRALILALNVLDGLPGEFFRNMDPERYQVLADVFRRTMLARNDSPFDPNLYAQVSHKRMQSRDYARRTLRRALKKTSPRMLEHLPEDPKRGETTHLSVMDRDGMAVSLTQSIERVYGSKAAADGLGFLYNNYIMDFQFDDPDHPFYLRPNSVPWATVAPSILWRDDTVWMAVGSPGSERIFSTIAQFLIRMLDQGMTMEAAMNAPRMHCSSGGKVSLEAGRFEPGVAEHFEAKGFKVDRLDDFAFYLGAIHAVVRRDDGTFEGVAEVRRDGSAAGPR